MKDHDEGYKQQQYIWREKSLGAGELRYPVQLTA